MEKSSLNGEGKALLKIKDQHESQRVCNKARREAPDMRWQVSRRARSPGVTEATERPSIVDVLEAKQILH